MIARLRRWLKGPPPPPIVHDLTAEPMLDDFPLSFPLRIDSVVIRNGTVRIECTGTTLATCMVTGVRLRSGYWSRLTRFKEGQNARLLGGDTLHAYVNYNMIVEAP